jgi:LmbE family N-acetylglucosaminyl deacetylase
MAGGWPERDLIPYEASTFSARRALVLAAHADDEVFGCAAAIADLRAKGAEVVVAILTDGAGEEGDPAARARIASARAAESRAALEALGGGTVEAGSLPDRGLSERTAEVSRELVRLLSAHRPDLVFVPSPSEIHPDHRALAEAFLDGASGDLAPHLGAATVAFYEVSQPIRPNFLLDATTHLAAKKKAMASFPSQNGARDYPRFVLGLNAYRAMTLGPSVAAAEAFRVIAGAELSAQDAGAREALRRAIGPSDGPRPEGVRHRRRIAGFLARVSRG